MEPCVVGGLCDVFVAEQVLLARRVVIKVLHPHLAHDAEVAERFRREAEAAAKLVHPHVCQILEPAVPPTDVSARIPQSLSDIVMRCLAEQPRDRFARGYDLADALIHVLRGQNDAGSTLRAASVAARVNLSPRF